MVTSATANYWPFGVERPVHVKSGTESLLDHLASLQIGFFKASENLP
jgi:hypothetical protein